MNLAYVKNRNANQGNSVHSTVPETANASTTGQITHSVRAHSRTNLLLALCHTDTPRGPCANGKRVSLSSKLFHTQTAVPHHRLTDMRHAIPQKLWITNMTNRSKRRARLYKTTRNRLPKQNYVASRLQTQYFHSTIARRLQAGHSFLHPTRHDGRVVHCQVSQAVLASLLDLELPSGSQAFMICSCPADRKPSQLLLI